MQEQNQKLQTFIEQVKAKMQATLADFANGKLNREQFHNVYQHYNAQISMAEQALSGAGAGASSDSEAQPTIAILESHMGKALGLIIYSRAGKTIETLGEFDVPPSKVTPLVKDFAALLAAGKPVAQRTEKMGYNRWLLFLAGQHTTVVCLFKNEPSPIQCREMERLHKDFETANAQMFQTQDWDAGKLAYPFLVFIQRKLKPTP